MKKFGHYEVTAELGRGGMGVVYKGWEPSLNRQVAIKCLGEHLLNDKDLVERFTREAKATAALNNPNVIQIYFIGEEKGQPFFAMEYIEGQSLDDILKGGNSLSVKHAKNLLKQACQGLAAAHEKDLVHRDIKPANLMLTKDGTLKIVDFGIARTREYGDKLTNTGEFVGTPGYLSPEVCIGKEVDQRSDIFSLGIVFYEMLAGKVPFENDSPLGLMLEVVQSDIPDIRALNKKVDKKTSYILNKMIAKSPDDRYQSCNEVIRDLGNIIDNETIANIQSNATVVAKTVKPKISEQITLPAIDAITAQNLTPVPDKKSGSGKKWLMAATVFAVLGAGAFGYYGGYLPVPQSSSNQQIVKLTDSTDTSPTESTNSSSPSTSQVLGPNANSKIKGQGIMVGLSSMFGESNEQDEVTVDESDQINFPEESLASTESSTEIEQPQEANFDIETDSTLSLSTSDTNANLAIDSNQKIDDTLQAQADDTSVLTQQPNTPQTSSIQVSDVEAITLPKQSELQTLAINTPTQKNIIAESKTSVPPISVESSSRVAQSVQQKPKRHIPKAVPLNKGVVVIAFGDPAVANPIEKILENELKAQGIKVMNEQFIPGMRQLLDNGLDLAELKSLIQKNGGQAMVIANVNYVGSQQLNYAGRSSELINAQLDVDAYEIKSGDSIGSGYGSKLSYTALNATDEATDAVMQFTDKLTASIKNKI